MSSPISVNSYHSEVYDDDDYVVHHYILDARNMVVWSLWVEDGYYADCEEEIARARERYSC